MDPLAGTGRPDAVAHGGTAAAARRFTTAVLVLLAGLAAFKIAASLRAPYPLDPADGGMLSSAWRVSQGEPIYNDLQKPPFIYNIHNPLMIYASALAFKIVGPAVWGPRTVSTFFFLATAFAAFAFVKRETGSRTAALVAALILIVNRPFISRAVLAACDYPAVFFSALGLYLWRMQGGARWLAPLSFALGYFSKQSAVAAPAAVMLALLLERNWRDALRFVIAYVIMMAAGFGLAWLAFGAPFFRNTLFLGAVGGVSPGGAIREFAVLALYAGPIAAVFFLAFRGRGWASRRLVPVYAAAGLVVALTAAREGGSRAYLFDLCLALALAAGLVWPRVEKGFEAIRSRTAGQFLTSALFIQAAFVAVATVSVVNFSYDWVKLRGTWGAGGRHLARRLTFLNPGMVLSPYTGYDVGVPGENFTTDPHRLGQLLEAGVVDRNVLVEAVENRSFSAVIIPPDERGFGIFDETLKQAVLRNYPFVDATSGDEYYAREQ